MTTTFDTWMKWLEVFRQWFLIPVCSVLLLLGKFYIDKHYVDREYFDRAMITLAGDKEKYAVEQKEDLKEINNKLDTLLQNAAGNNEKFNDSERRLSKVEEKIDRLSMRKP